MTSAEIAAEVASLIMAGVRAATAAERRFALAIPGGSVASAILPRLAAAAADWRGLDLTVVDERLVPLSDPDSNLGLARRLWLDALPSPGPRVIGPPVGSGMPDEIARAWEAHLVEALGAPPALDVAILGVGPDGHVASLFPGHAALECRDRWVLALHDAPKPPPDRLTLTLPVIAAAAEVWIVAFGGAKAPVLSEARRDPGSRLPVALAARGARAVRWFLDADAGG
jgi:6-phosphogluconolactonase